MNTIKGAGNPAKVKEDKAWAPTELTFCAGDRRSKSVHMITKSSQLVARDRKEIKKVLRSRTS